MKQKQGHVVLIGHNFTSILGLARALGKQGYSITALRSGINLKKSRIARIGTTPEAHSKYIQKHIIINPDDEEKVIQILKEDAEIAEKSNKSKSILIPVDDVCAMLIDRHYNQLQQYYYLPNVGKTQNGIIQLMDKYYQKSLAKAAGLLVAEGWSIDINSGRYSIPEEIKYPCFAKAQLPFTRRKQYMGKCDNPEELRTLLNNVTYEGNCRIIVEEFLEIEKEYCVVGVCNKTEVCIPEIIEETVMGHNKHAGVTCFGKIIPPGAYKETIDKLKLFLVSLDFQGIFTIDLLECSGNLYFCELNARIGGSGIAVIGAGVDIASMYVSSITGESTIPYDSKCKAMTFASERPLLNDLVTGQISFKQYRRYYQKADYRFIYSQYDRKPYYFFMIYCLREIMKCTIHKKN